MQKNQWSDIPYSEDMGAEMLEYVQEKDNLTDYSQAHRLVTSTLLVKRNTQARGVTQAYHYNQQVMIDEALAKIDNYDMRNRSQFETKAVDQHNAMVAKTEKELEKLTRQAVTAMAKVLEKTRKMVEIQDAAIQSSRLMDSLNGRGYIYHATNWRHHKTAWKYQFDSVLPPRELSLQIAKALVLRTDAYNGDAEKVCNMPPDITRFSHDPTNQG